MGFDQNERQSLIHPRRWGTKVNFGVVLGIIVFLILGFIMINHFRSRAKVANGTHQKSEN